MEPLTSNTIILSGVGILISLYFSFHSKKLAHEKMMKDLFDEFNRRYSELNNYLSEIEATYPTTEKLNASENAMRLKQALQDYFNLCAEEFYWYYHKGRIDKIVWNSWHKGMLYWYGVPAIREMWETKVGESGKESYYITDDHEFFK
jgi:hypothetical protein